MQFDGEPAQPSEGGTLAALNGWSRLKAQDVLCCILYLEGHGDIVSRLISRINRLTIWVIGVINLLTKSP